MHVNYIVAHASPIVRMLEEKGVSNLLIEVEGTKLRKKNKKTNNNANFEGLPSLLVSPHGRLPGMFEQC